MCKVTIHRMKCGHPVVKFHDPCHLSSRDAQGIFRCHCNDPSRSIEVEHFTWGPGICADINCRQKHGILPRDYASNSDPYVPDVEPFDMSPEARIESERRWRQQKTPQELEEIDSHCKAANDFRRAIVPPYMPTSVINHPRLHAWEAIHLTQHFSAYDKFPDLHTPEWWALNPRYMTAWELYQNIPLFLDIYVANPGAELRGPAAQHPDLVALIESQEDTERYDFSFGSSEEHGQEDEGGTGSQASSIAFDGISPVSSAIVTNNDGGFGTDGFDSSHDGLAKDMDVE